MLNVCFEEGVFYLIRDGLSEKSVCSYVDLCYGRISPEDFDEVRKQRINRVYAECSQKECDEMIFDEKARFECIIKCAVKDKELRLWYANNSADKCGLYHLVHALKDVDCKIFVVKMPDCIGSRSPVGEKSWGEADLDHFAACLPLAKELSAKERDTMADKWERLAALNSELRITIAGEVISVPVDYLDNVILSYAPDDSDFCAGYLVGQAFRYEAHCFNWDFVECRIEYMIKNGKLAVVERKDDPELWNMMVLRKIKE